VLDWMRFFTLTTIVTICALVYTAGSPSTAAHLRRNLDTVRSALMPAKNLPHANVIAPVR
jgi:hypothetical protein